MGTQNLNNYYFNKLEAKLNYSSYYDFFLASDERDYKSEVIWSPNIIGFTDQSVLPVIIDLSNSLSSSQPVTTATQQFPVFTGTPQSSEPFTIQSSVEWVSAQTICDCGTVISPYDICSVSVGKTARSNGLYHDINIDNLLLIPPQDCVKIFKTIPTVSNFNKLHFGKKFKMSQVKAYGMPPPPGSTLTYYTDTSIMNANDSSGYYQELRGGFYQGFYKLQGYDYQVLPTRPNKGWTFSTYLKVNTIGDTLLGPNDPDPVEGVKGVFGNCYNTSGFNVFENITTATTWFSSSATTLNSPYIDSNSPPHLVGGPNHLLNYSWMTTAINASGETVGVINSGRTDNNGFFFFKGTRLGMGTSLYSNAIGFRITDDMRIGYRALRYSGDCIPEGDCTDEANFICSLNVEESYSDPICPFISQSGSCENVWMQVDVVFERNYYLEDCDLLNIGGINDLMMTNTTYANYLPYAYDLNDPCDTFQPGQLDFTCTGVSVSHWFNEKKYRMGTLKFYVNGRVVHKVENYEEIIPRHLNGGQFGVPYTMSWGGGAFGYRESGLPISNSSDLIAQHFGGSFIGGISKMMYYIKPLTADEVYHNFLINKSRYNLVDCEECKNCNDGCTDCNQDESAIAMPGANQYTPSPSTTYQRCSENWYFESWVGEFDELIYIPGTTYPFNYQPGDIVDFEDIPMLDGTTQYGVFQLLNAPTGGWITNPANESEFFEQSPVYDSGIYWNYIPCDVGPGDVPIIFGCVDPTDPSYDPSATVDNSIQIGPITYYPLC